MKSLRTTNTFLRTVMLTPTVVTPKAPSTVPVLMAILEMASGAMVRRS